MFDFLTPRTKVKAWTLKEVPIEKFEIVGIGQINPYCDMQYENKIIVTVLNFAPSHKSCEHRLHGLRRTVAFSWVKWNGGGITPPTRKFL